MNRVLTNEEANERELLVFGENYDPEAYKYGGCRRFDEMDLETAKRLVELGYLDPEEDQNGSPTTQDYIDFCESWPDVPYTMHGYVISPTRNDCRITLEGLSCEEHLTPEQALEFLKAFRYADECCVDYGAWCWWD